jgi:outer membrane murein-binding lipoprotein Lpp
VTSHSSVAGAAALAGLLVAGGAYAARHDVGLGPAVQASAAARARLEQELAPGRERRAATHTLVWRPPHVPRIRVHAPPAAPAAASVPAPAYVTAAPALAAAPVTRTSPAPPTTRTSPVGGDDEGGGGDD